MGGILSPLIGLRSPGMAYRSISTSRRSSRSIRRILTFTSTYNSGQWLVSWRFVRNLEGIWVRGDLASLQFIFETPRPCH